MSPVQRGEFLQAVRSWAAGQSCVKEIWLTSVSPPFEVVAFGDAETTYATACELGDSVDAFEAKYKLGIGDTFLFVAYTRPHLRIMANKDSVKIWPV